jgi:hypothetical protein
MNANVVNKKKLRVWYRLWENSDRITIEEKEWAEKIFSNEVNSYDLTFITTDEFLDYLNNSPQAKKDFTDKQNEFDFVELIYS